MHVASTIARCVRMAGNGLTLFVLFLVVLWFIQENAQVRVLPS